MVRKDYEEEVIKKYGSWENNINSNVLYFYKFIDSIDKGIVDFLKILNNCGCHTVFSCSGHKENSIAYVDFASYISKDKVFYEINRIFNVGSSEFSLIEKTLSCGVSLVRMIIPYDKKELFGIVTIPKGHSDGL